MAEMNFELAGAQLEWPIGTAAGMTNHPNIEVVANRLENLASSGFSFVLGGSWTLGDERGGNGYEKINAEWVYKGGDEYVDAELMAGYNAKGLPSPGTDIGMPRLPDLVDMVRSNGVEFALSFSPHGGEPLDELKEIYYLGQAALTEGVLYVEVNLSCPNVPGKPAFYLDDQGVQDYYQFLSEQPVLLNRHGHPGLWHKYGPRDNRSVLVPPSGGVVSSNTKGNQEPKLADGTPAIEVNNGKGGMSGPALRELGRAQLALWNGIGDQRISVLGIDSGSEIKYRLDNDASAVQLGSAIYWPNELADCDTPAEVLDKFKRELIDAYEAA